MRIVMLLKLHEELRRILFGGHPLFHCSEIPRPCVKDADVVMIFKLWDYEATLTTAVSS